jgi:hypothetical protein
MRTRRVVVAVAALGLFTCLAAWLLSPPRPGVSRANADRIHWGITRPQVEAILGRAPDSALHFSTADAFIWVGEGVEVQVAAGHDGTALIASARPPEPESALRRLARQIGIHLPV